MGGEREWEESESGGRERVGGEEEELEERSQSSMVPQDASRKVSLPQLSTTSLLLEKVVRRSGDTRRQLTPVK